MFQTPSRIGLNNNLTQSELWNFFHISINNKFQSNGFIVWGCAAGRASVILPRAPQSADWGTLNMSARQDCTCNTMHMHLCLKQWAYWLMFVSLSLYILILPVWKFCNWWKCLLGAIFCYLISFLSLSFIRSCIAQFSFMNLWHILLLSMQVWQVLLNSVFIQFCLFIFS